MNEIPAKSYSSTRTSFSIRNRRSQMARFNDTEPLTRRDLLQRLAIGAFSAPLLAPIAAAGQKVIPNQPFPFKLGLQSYSLRKFPLEDALAKTKALGLTWWEGYPGHIPITDDASKIASYRQ